MKLRPEMFTGRKLDLFVYEKSVKQLCIQIDMLPEEAIRLLDQLSRFQRMAKREEQLSAWVYNDRDYRIGWKRRARKINLLIRRDGIVWTFDTKTEEGPESIETKPLESDDLLVALLDTAHLEAFSREFQQFAKDQPERALQTLEGWLELDPRSIYGDDIVPLTEQDLVPILDADDPDLRNRAMSLLPRLNLGDDAATTPDAA